MDNKLEKLYVIIFAILISIPTNAQISIRGGVNKSNVSFKNGGIQTETNDKAGIQAGLLYKLSIGDRIAFRPGLIFSVKGFEENGLDVDFKYAEVPASFLFYVASNQNGIYIELGPYVGTGIDSDIGEFGKDLKRLDLGLNVGAGFELGRFGVGFTFGFGLANIVDGEITNSGDSVKNDNLGIFGYIEF